MLTLAIFDCDADELIIDPALRAKWHIDLISAHEVIDYGISAGIIAAFVKADRFIFERTAATNSAEWPSRSSAQPCGSVLHRKRDLVLPARLAA